MKPMMEMMMTGENCILENRMVWSSLKVRGGFGEV